MQLKVDALVVGAGVVGLAVARELALAGREVIVLESEDRIGSGISARNSEVVHAGIYYPSGSLKALTCVAGKQLLYDYCQHKNIPHQRCGKLIVATNREQLSQLKALQAKALANQVSDLRLLSKAEAESMEPDIPAAAALYSPSTGIVDSHRLMLALQGDIESTGGWVALRSKVVSGSVAHKRIVITVAGEDSSEVEAGLLINATGLHATRLLSTVTDYPRERIPPMYFAKGDYFALSGKSPCQHLLYPLPEPGGLGIHLTLDMAGQARFGPDVEWLESLHPDTLDYDIDPNKEHKFRRAIGAYWPAIQQRTLLPAYSGIRPKLSPQGTDAQDFVIDSPEQHGIAGWYNLFGIESPGLTAALALARLVADRVLAD